MKLAKALPLLISVLLGFATIAAATEPDQVVRDYIDSFKQKDKQRMFVCLDDVFFSEFKIKYLKTIEGYSQEKKALLLQTFFDVGSVEALQATSGREILSKFLDTPASDGYWKGFDSVDLVIEAETPEKKDQRATVRSFLSAKGSAVKVETIYSLVRSDDTWKIERFQKRRVEPNKSSGSASPSGSKSP